MSQKQKIWLSIFGVVAILGVFAIIATTTIIQNRSTLTPDGVVMLFYNEWSEQAGVQADKPLANKLHERSTYVTPALAQAVNNEYAKTAQDPILCAATPPESISVELLSEKENYASVAVFDTDGPRFARAVLTRDDKGWWRIDEVDCLS